MGSDNSKEIRNNSLPQGTRAHPDIQNVSRRLGNDQEIRVKKIYHVTKPIERPPTPPEPVPVMIVQQPTVQRVVQVAQPVRHQVVQIVRPPIQQIVHVSTPPRQVTHSISPTVNEFRRPVILNQGNQDILRISRLE